MYDTYINYVRSICDTKNFSGFKSNPNYTPILEHVSKDQGIQYLDCIFSRTSITKNEVEEFCHLNDAFGDPEKYNDNRLDISVSPTSLRYIYHAHLILTHMKAVGNLNADIIEVGGGYGGLCISLNHFAAKYGIRFNSYRMCDLSDIIRLQKIYITAVNPSLNIEFLDAASFGKNIECDNMFLISNYCFSELPNREDCNSYQRILFPKVAHGFMAWNFIPVYDFGFVVNVEPEIPQTGPMNKYVYF
jgi:hypothetical protein